MSVAGLAMTIAIALIVLVLGVLVWGVVTYNGLVRRRNAVQEAWQQIDVELTRRHDLIPNLVETVKGYAAHERSTLEDVVRARQAAVTAGSGPRSQAEAENVLSAALGRLFALAEGYPTLRANENFLALQHALAQTEDRVASGRRFYNATVRALNTSVESFPQNVIAGMFHFDRAEYFEADQTQVATVPQVSFGAARPPASGPQDSV